MMNHVTDYVGIIQGDVMQQLLARYLISDQFQSTSPTLEVVATRDPQCSRHIFSHQLTPQVPISQAVVASCAIRTVFSIRKIEGQGYIDAAQNDPVPLECVVDDHIRAGKDPDKLFIVGTFVHTFDRLLDIPPNLFGRREHYDRHANGKIFFYQKDKLVNQRIRFLIFELDATKVHLPPANPFSDFPVLGSSLSELRRLFAQLTHRESLERFLRSVSHYLYEQINLQHLSLYLESFEPRLMQKISRHVDEIIKPPN